MSSAIKTGYSRRQIILHWVIAALVLIQLVVGGSMVAVVEAGETGGMAPVLDQRLALLHFWAGLSILMLVTARITIRLVEGAPVVTGPTPLLGKLASLTHGLFYLLLFAVPLTGILGYFVGDPWGELHAMAKPVFIVLIVAHVLGALVHHFWMKDGVLRRMLVPARD